MTCSVCKAVKPQDGFKSCPSCRKRQREAQRRWRARHPGLEVQRYHENLEESRRRSREAAKRLRHSDPEKTKKQRAIDRAALLARDPDYFKRWRQQNRDAHREYKRRWNAANPDRVREYWNQRRAAKGPANRDTERFMVFLLTQPCAYCGSTDAIEIDHIVPLSRGGRHAPENLTSACRPCNRSKADKLPEEWNATKSLS